MTSKQLFDYALIELSKVNAPSLLLHEFNYYINKAYNQFINKRYNIYDVNQQTTDDLRVLKSTVILEVTPSTIYSNKVGNFALSKTYEVILPSDYFHILNCICIYRMKKSHQCYDKDEYVEFAAKRLTADAWSTILNDYYNRPKPENPYYYIHNINTSTTLPTNPVITSSESGEGESKTITYLEKVGGTDMVGLYDVNLGVKTVDGKEVTDSDILAGAPETVTTRTTNGGTNFNRIISIGDQSVSTVERSAGHRYGNASQVRCEIRYGRDDSVFQLEKVLIDYIKVPQTIRLTKT